MIGWIILILIVAAIFVMMKTKALKHKITWFVIIIVVIVLYIGYSMSVAKADINWNSTQGVQTAVKLYLSWFVNVFHNSQSLTGQAVNLNWEGNKTEIANTKALNNTPEIKKQFYK